MPSEGGLGLMDIRSWNLALLTKTLWNNHCKKDTLWIKCVNQVQLYGSNIWVYMPRKEDSPFIEKLLAIRDCITGAKQSTQRAVDRLSSWTTGDKFSIAEAYEHFRPKGVQVIWAKAVWNAYVTPKHAFITWLAPKLKLLTKDRLRFLQIDTRCSFCALTNEIVGHLFFNCSFSRSV